ncbi:hypothetical protein CfE428DRAFT_3943 [Chthoniobacter flavus Ellin428]|uniref:Uncharacterized protein n=1 Tax=Chthoniobacter flavus Ellin428 TaxID=497964 RepID=B4D4V5_9BACT|nr:hypothetical protein CfE428DRAFT_3943 [Chthoniobacter flavus Ellin428]TCO90987.1 hypothetical protein EV701_109137 [Chthoniobacter flavus]
MSHIPVSLVPKLERKDAACPQEYTISIPNTKASFVFFKNNRGDCEVRSTSGVLLVETNSRAGIMSTTR